MQNDQDQDEIDYEVGQEQLDAVDRMLEELDMDEQFDRVPAAFRIVERFEQQQEQQRHLASRNSSNGSNGGSSNNTFSGANGYHRGESHTMPSSSVNGGDRDFQGYTMQGSDAEEMDQDQQGEDSDDEMAGEPFGYIPLDQDGDINGMDDDDDEGEEEEEESNENEGYAQMDSDNENEHENAIEQIAEEEGDTEQGYDGYLRRRNRDGTVPVPVIPAAVQIDLATLNDDDELNEDGTAAAAGVRRSEAAAELIPDEDLKTIAMVMSSFSLPAPEWAQSIPEDRWLPRIVQRAEASGSSGSGTFSGMSANANNATISAERFDIATVTTAPSILATATDTTAASTRALQP
ncbi:hypothetical protein BG015_005310 [Linnemannia schmuckeri]|uniref:Uncharacterized protein n=1 Tax=Linnemannia schmuckeri TaxID=64567 RepID=A0A9P5S3K9_9FUNG|nr:hypothetical protein BG015_005310 [Linnemannia schmuckeri]